MTFFMMFVSGNLQVIGTELSKGMDAGISGVAGIGHIILGDIFIRVLISMGKLVKTKALESIIVINDLIV